ncbi:hypothetical protein L798_08152 [Zootermopsis nevadensis]|uniref:Gustatory receptor n=1 Tax=Zootermopsis nevadensis TaxID=136037 RepID=A0A067RDA6_ZOONE|nr:hypothetical protein L798_08152 [Zootermopsis nevadensis]
MYRREESVIIGRNRPSMAAMNKIYFENLKVLRFEVVDRSVKRGVTLDTAENKDELYPHQMKPILVVMRIFSIFPVELSSEVPRFRLISPIMAYSVCFYAVTMISTYFNVCNIASALLFKKNNLLFSTVLLSIIISVFMCCYMPLLCWVDIKGTVQYMKKWMKFQEIFLSVTKQHLTLALRRRCFIYAAISVLLGTVLSFFGCYMPGAKFCGFPLYYIFLTLTTCLESYWIIGFNALAIAGCSLAKRFKNDLRQTGPSAKMIEEYRILRLRLSRLVSDAGGVMGKVMIVNVISFGCLASMSLYTSLSMDSEERKIEKIGMGTLAATGILHLYSLCNAASKATYSVKTMIQEELQFIRISSESDAVGKAVTAFLQTILLNPPIISMLGFADINRGLFTAYASATVTYLVVLLQFDLGERVDKYDMNIVQNCTGV